jgi:hypothetical protein
MKKNIAFCCLLFAIACASPDAKKEDSVLAEKPSAPADPTGVVIEETDAKLVDTTKKSIKAYASNTINGIKCVINYHSPAVRGRQVWGGLVPYNQPWVGGAHMATSLEVGSDFVVNGKEIAAGKYALFTIPNPGDWTVIINKNWQQHLTDEYDAKDDLVRFTVKTDSLKNQQERLRYVIRQTGEYKGAIWFEWDRICYSFPIELKR